ncbi:MAG: hypothetical protein IJ460_04820 [Clostridia bacterium]|nr:hypothetical protein [Clostridia bacterium]
MKSQADFGAEDEARLTPCEDDKPKDAGITLFKAGSDYYLSANKTSLKTDKTGQFSTSIA